MDDYVIKVISRGYWDIRGPSNPEYSVNLREIWKCYIRNRVSPMRSKLLVEGTGTDYLNVNSIDVLFKQWVKDWVKSEGSSCNGFANVK